MPLLRRWPHPPEGCRQGRGDGAEFGKEWLLEFEPTKSQELIITNLVADNKVAHPPLSMGGVVVEEKEKLEALGFTIDPRGNWSVHAPNARGSSQGGPEEAWCH